MKKTPLVLIAWIALLMGLVGSARAQAVSPNYVETTVKQYDASGAAMPDLLSREYSDGLGRSIESKTFQNTNYENPIIATGTQYDSAGRPRKTLKPFAGTGALNASRMAYEDLDFTSRLYSEIAYYDDPLSRVKEQAAPGMDFGIKLDANGNDTGHTVKYWYFPTIQSSASIYDLDANGFIRPEKFWSSGSGKPRLAMIGYLDGLPQGQIPGDAQNASTPTHFLTIVMDENDNVTQKVDDVFGRTLATWALSGPNTAVISYNAYDILGNLLVETPPTSANPLQPTSYSYNTLGQLVSKTIPDIGASTDNVSESYTYDDVGNVTRVTRNMGNPPLAYEDIVISYDRFNRVIANYKGPAPLTVTSTTVPELEYFYDGYSNFSTDVQATFQSQFLNNCSLTPSDRATVISDLSNDDNARGHVTAAFAINRFTTQQIVSHYSQQASTAHSFTYYVGDFYTYNEEGRVRTHYKSIPSIPLQKFSYGYDLTGRLIADTLSGQTDGRILSYVYDADGRLAQVWNQSGLLVKYSFDSIGRQDTTRYYQKNSSDPGANNYTVSCTFDTARDWLTSIKALPQNAQPLDFLETPVYQGGSPNTPQFNGNISRTSYSYGTRVCSGSGTMTLDYSYDPLNRLTNTAVSGTWSSSNPTDFDELFNYTDDGRISTKWEGKYANSPTSPDNNYTYYQNSSRLRTIGRESSSNGYDAQYYYDYYGNLIYDAYKKMAVTYDWRNMPVLFSFFGPEIAISGDSNGCLTPDQLESLMQAQGNVPISQVIMLYDAGGNRVAKFERNAISGVN